MKAQDLERIKTLITNKQLIEAIKLYRKLTTVGLREAKEAVECLQAGKPIAGLVLAESALPEKCPECAARLSTVSVSWLAPDVAECSFCGCHLTAR